MSHNKKKRNFATERTLLHFVVPLPRLHQRLLLLGLCVCFRSPMTPVTGRDAMHCIAMRPIDRPTDACWKVSTAKTCQIFFMLINLKNTNTTNATTNSRQYIVATKSECNRNSNTFCLERSIFIKSLCFQTSNNFICCAAGKRVRSRTHTSHWLLGDALFWSVLNY